MDHCEMVRAQKKTLEIFASFARNDAAERLLGLPKSTSSQGAIEMIDVPKDVFDSILVCAMDKIAQQSGGKDDTKQEVALALMDAETPFPDKLVASLMSYAGHWGEIDLAEQLCWAFRGRQISRLTDKEMSEYFQTQAYLEESRRRKRLEGRIPHGQRL